MKPFSDFLAHLVGEKGQGALADEIGADASELSRFRSGQGPLRLVHIDRIFELADVVIVPREEYDRDQELLAGMTEKWLKSRNGKKGEK